MDTSFNGPGLVYLRKVKLTPVGDDKEPKDDGDKGDKGDGSGGKGGAGDKGDKGDGSGGKGGAGDKGGSDKSDKPGTGGLRIRSPHATIEMGGDVKLSRAGAHALAVDADVTVQGEINAESLKIDGLSLDEYTL